MTIRRKYPEAPIAAVGAVVVDGGQFLLIRRAQEPLKGEWSLPGGAVELGETLEQAVCREVFEETGLLVKPVRMLKVIDGISREADGRVLYHYVLVDYACEVIGGTLCCETDAAEARWMSREQLDGAGVGALIIGVVDLAFSVG